MTVGLVIIPQGVARARLDGTFAYLCSLPVARRLLLFSPITFPASRLPAWFQTVHDVLPVRPAADLLRAGLASTTYDASLGDLAVLVVWCVAGMAVSIRALVRRQ